MTYDKFIRSLIALKGLKANLPDRYEVEVHWVNEFHSALETIESEKGIDLSEYKVPQNKVARTVVSGNYRTGEVNYSDELYCERSILFQKLETSIKYLDYISSRNSGKKSTDTENIEIDLTKVFIVHGHNELLKETVARFVEKLGLNAIILHEQPNKGKTIIGKFEEYSDVAFAIVLITADDVGGKKVEGNIDLKPRARQNVIFELGYFIGKISRNNVCALYEEGVEIPSDYHGVVFETIDTKGNWKFAVAKELKAAGLKVDMNNIL